jgi:hypothetical protein
MEGLSGSLQIEADMISSDPAEGNVKLPKILLNGNNICMVLLTDIQHT